MLCNNEQDKINQEQSETKTKEAHSEEDRLQRYFELIRVDLCLITSCEMGAALLIYDLKYHQMMWSGFIQKTLPRSNERSRTYFAGMTVLYITKLLSETIPKQQLKLISLKKF
ncbi:hypothetical protein D8Y20_08440 [Mariprofundus sp. EBB-1]|uniref:hypothetical protein n=1 Tax=Mariprofundus sp. EBB-1 TaxID=2650971 RepID=UPI000EF17EB5|nr:hypothetical protein [Mariprofundus sp. EBB-1]RLL51904.1 hypothetical protein D8Y20_08440 [Mariprofundus sp. EBB-1]